jgi:hypothetical protein
MKMMRSAIALPPVEVSGAFKRVYERQIKPFEIFCVARGERGAVLEANRGNFDQEWP